MHGRRSHILIKARCVKSSKNMLQNGSTESEITLADSYQHPRFSMMTCPDWIQASAISRWKFDPQIEFSNSESSKPKLGIHFSKNDICRWRHSVWFSLIRFFRDQSFHCEKANFQDIAFHKIVFGKFVLSKLHKTYAALKTIEGRPFRIEWWFWHWCKPSPESSSPDIPTTLSTCSGLR